MVRKGAICVKLGGGVVWAWMLVPYRFLGFGRQGAGTRIERKTLKIGRFGHFWGFWMFQWGQKGYNWNKTWRRGSLCIILHLVPRDFDQQMAL